MRVTPKRIMGAMLAILAMLATLAIFAASVKTWGSWWRIAGMPSAEEWSALFGASALVALGFAWYQIRQVDQSNRLLIGSNELSRLVDIESIRPRVQVVLRPQRQIGKNRHNSAVTAVLYVAVDNIGASPARDVRLSVNPPFLSSDEFFSAISAQEYFEEMNASFDGEVAFPALHPGASHVWYLGLAPAIFDDSPDMPRRWEVTASYKGDAISTPFNETFILDLDNSRNLQLPPAPLERISREIETLGSKLNDIKDAISNRR